MRLLSLTLTLFLSAALLVQAQQVPSQFLATFGNMSDTTCGDDDFSQAVFFAIPAHYQGNFYLRVFDPDCGGLYDQPDGLWETNTMIEVFGGDGCISSADARGTHPVGNYRSGTSLDRALFSRESMIDAKWYSFGPFTVDQGEELADYPDYRFFKLLVDGRTGNDGNVYAIQVSQKPSLMQPLKYARQFAFKTTTFQDGVVVSRTEPLPGESAGKPDGGIILPVTLEELEPDRGLDIIVEPVND